MCKKCIILSNAAFYRPGRVCMGSLCMTEMARPQNGPCRPCTVQYFSPGCFIFQDAWFKLFPTEIAVSIKIVLFPQHRSQTAPHFKLRNLPLVKSLAWKDK